MAVYAAFSAAERQAPHVRQPKTWLGRKRVLDLFARQVQGKEVDSGENLVVLVPADMGIFLPFEADSHVGSRVLGALTPVQTYVDLTHCGGAARRQRRLCSEQKILPAWKAAAPS